MADKPNKIFTLKNECTAEYKEKSSLFIAKAFPLTDETEFSARLSEIKKEHYKARHHCYAFRLPDSSKYSDDGEPSGTAGIRIINAIDHFSLQFVGIVVVRYFGGVKLGVGPLGKAYYTAAHDAIQQAELSEKKLCVRVIISSPLTEQHLVFSLLSRAGITDIKSTYGEDCVFETLVRKEELEGVQNLFREHYNIKISSGTEIYI